MSWFQILFEARRIIANWRRKYNERRPHRSLNYMTPTEFAAKASRGKDASPAWERPWRFPLSHRYGALAEYYLNAENGGRPQGCCQWLMRQR